MSVAPLLDAEVGRIPRHPHSENEKEPDELDALHTADPPSGTHVALTVLSRVVAVVTFAISFCNWRMLDPHAPLTIEVRFHIESILLFLCISQALLTLGADLVMEWCISMFAVVFHLTLNIPRASESHQQTFRDMSFFLSIATLFVWAMRCRET